MKDTASGKIGMLLLPNFNGMAAHAFIDPFRAANYLTRKLAYKWDLLSLKGGTVTASSGLSVADTASFSEAQSDLDLVVVNASWTPETFSQPKLLGWLRKFAREGATICGIDTGAFVMAHAGLLDGYCAAVHYEHMAAFRELFPAITLDETLFVSDRERMSCAGGIAAVDMALEIIRLQQGTDLANAAARYIFHDRLRAGTEGQLSAKYEPIGYTVPDQVRNAILLMERNVERPLRQAEIAGRLGVSQRQLERLFVRFTGMPPVRYYLNVRLDNARGFVTQTEMPISQIAYACGFNAASQFSRSYRKRFGVPPGQDRAEGRIPFQFRSFPIHAAQ